MIIFAVKEGELVKLLHFILSSFFSTMLVFGHMIINEITIIATKMVKNDQKRFSKIVPNAGFEPTISA